LILMLIASIASGNPDSRHGYAFCIIEPGITA